MTGSGELADQLDVIAKRHEVDRAAVATAFLLAHPAKITPVMVPIILSEFQRFQMRRT